jgi:hypothetical protein
MAGIRNHNKKFGRFYLRMAMIAGRDNLARSNLGLSYEA